MADFEVLVALGVIDAGDTDVAVLDVVLYSGDTYILDA